MKKLLATLLPLLLLTFSYTPKGFSQAKMKSWEMASALKEGALLVRLRTGSMQISAYELKGDLERKAAVQKKIKAENEKVLAAFKAYYSFSDVYFFYSDDKEQIKTRDFDGVLYNADLEKVAVEVDYFLIASLDQAPHTGIPCILLRDEKFRILEEPFPSVFRTYTSLAKMENGLKKGIGDLDRRMNGLYRKALKKGAS